MTSAPKFGGMRSEDGNEAGAPATDASAAEERPIVVLHLADTQEDRQQVRDALEIDASSFRVLDPIGRPVLAEELRMDCDLILAGLHVPGLEGLAVLDAAIKACPQTPVVIAADPGHEAELAEAPGRGAARCLVRTEHYARRLAYELRSVLARRQAQEANLQAEAQAQAGESRFETTFAQAGVGMALVDRQGRYLRVNDKLCRMLGYTREELTALTFMDITAPQDLAYSSAQMEQITSGRTLSLNFEKCYRHKNGELLWVALTIAAAVKPTGGFDYLITIVEDVTARHKAQSLVEAHVAQQRLLAAFGQQALANTDIDVLMAQAAQTICEGAGVPVSRILQLAPPAGQTWDSTLEFKGGTGWESAGHPYRIDGAAHSQECYVLASGAPVLVADYAQEARFDPAAEMSANGLASGVEIAIAGADKRYGLIGAYAREPRDFAPECIDFLRSIANILATAIERKRTEDQLAHLGQFDPLTGLPGRRLFRDRLDQAMAQARRNGQFAALLHLDIDRFKYVNDTFGHAAGDALLIEVSRAIKRCVRQGDTVARLEGDEFGIILTSLARADDAGRVARKIHGALAASFNHGGEEVFISASTGIAISPGDGDHVDGLIRNATFANNRAKELGRNNYQFYTTRMNQRTETRLRLESQLRRAVERGEFLLHYQPKVGLTDGRISGAEALLRWNHPDRGLVSPGEFIPLLEDTGMILPVGLWVLQAACEQLRAWDKAGLDLPEIAVNLCPRQFQQADFAERAMEAVFATGIDPGRVEFEITESMLMKEPELAAAQLDRLKQLGFMLSVDDFGTGYSSLAYLKRFPLDKLKIDRAFIQDLAANPDDAAIAQAIISLAHRLRLSVVAEGVENEGQLNFLIRHGCDHLQGFIFSPPVTADELARTLGEDRRLDIHDGHAAGRPSLLFLDDDPDEIYMLQRALAPEGYEFLAASAAQRAFELLAANDVQMVVADQHMPGMSGVEFLSRVKQVYPNIARVMLTASADPKDVADAVNHAAVHKFMSKSWSPDQWRNTLREAFAQATAAETQAPQNEARVAGPRTIQKYAREKAESRYQSDRRLFCSSYEAVLGEPIDQAQFDTDDLYALQMIERALLAGSAELRRIAKHLQVYRYADLDAINVQAPDRLDRTWRLPILDGAEAVPRPGPPAAVPASPAASFAGEQQGEMARSTEERVRNHLTFRRLYREVFKRDLDAEWFATDDANRNRVIGEAMASGHSELVAAAHRLLDAEGKS